MLTFTFDAYAVLNSGGLPSHSSGAGLFASSRPAPAGFGFEGTSWWFNRTFGGWQFDARMGVSGSEDFERIDGEFDKPVNLSIVVDKMNLQLWGRYDFGNENAGETARFTVTREQVDALDLVELTHDFRFAASRASEIDNIEVTAGPSTPISHLPQITDIWLAGEARDEVKIRWVTEPSVTYLVERSADLQDWETAIESIPGNGSPVVVTGKTSLVGRQQYYRITGGLVPLS